MLCIYLCAAWCPLEVLPALNQSQRLGIMLIAGNEGLSAVLLGKVKAMSNYYLITATNGMYLAKREREYYRKHQVIPAIWEGYKAKNMLMELSDCERLRIGELELTILNPNRQTMSLTATRGRVLHHRGTHWTSDINQAFLFGDKVDALLTCAHDLALSDLCERHYAVQSLREAMSTWEPTKDVSNAANGKQKKIVESVPSMLGLPSTNKVKGKRVKGSVFADYQLVTFQGKGVAYRKEREKHYADTLKLAKINAALVSSAEKADKRPFRSPSLPQSRTLSLIRDGILPCCDLGCLA